MCITSIQTFSFSSFSRPWYSTWEAKGAENKEQGTGRAPALLPTTLLALTSMSFCFCRWSSMRLLVVMLSFSQSPCTCRMALWTWPSSSSSYAGQRQAPWGSPSIPTWGIAAPPTGEPLEHHPADRPTSDPTLGLLGCRHSPLPPLHGLASRDPVHWCR